MLNFDFLENGVGIVSPPHFVYDFSRKMLLMSGVVLETEGSIRKIQKRALFHYKLVKKGLPNLTSPMFIVSLQLL